MELTKRHRNALEVLRSECDYEDSRVGDDLTYVLWAHVAGAGGPKTRSDLVCAGYAVEGVHRWSGKVGHRITLAGREALKRPQVQKSPRSSSRIRQLSPRVKELSRR